MKKCKYQKVTPKGYYDYCTSHRWFRPLLCSVEYLKCPNFKPTVLYRIFNISKTILQLWRKKIKERF